MHRINEFQIGWVVASRPVFSIVIPTRKRAVELKTCLDNLVTQLCPGDEIIVSEDDEFRESENLLKARYQSVKWILGPCKGPSANRNNGAKSAVNDYLVFLDDDCVPSTNLLNAYRNYLEKNSQIDAIEGAIRPLGKKTSLAAECPINEVGGVFWTCNVLIRRTTFISIGGFDEHYPFAGMEDVDIYKRLRQNRSKIDFLAAADVYHPWAVRKDMRAKFHHRLSVLLYLSKYPEESRRFSTINFMRIIKSHLKDLLLDGIIKGQKDKYFQIKKILLVLEFAWIFRGKYTKHKYIADVKPCCRHCAELILHLKALTTA